MGKILADQYSDICTEPRSQMDDVGLIEMINDTNDVKFENIVVNKEMVIKAINKLLSKSGQGLMGSHLYGLQKEVI